MRLDKWGTCSECGETGVLTRTCNHCQKEVCTSHTLPEKHNCPAVAHYGKGTKHLQSDLEARHDPDTETTHKQESELNTVENPRTYGGSGRDSDNADFPSSPDVNPDGTVADPDIEYLAEKYANDDDDANSRRLAVFKKRVTPYLLVVSILLILQFGLGINVFSILAELTS